jgi:hypothetical protein
VWESSSPQVRTRLAALYTTGLASATTTALYDINISRDDMVGWGMGLDINHLALSVFSSPFNTPPYAGSDLEVIMLEAPKKAFLILLSCSVLSHLYPQQMWISKFGQHPHANGSLAPYADFCPPQLFRILF